MKDKVINFKSTKAVKNNKLKTEYECPGITNDMFWIVKALEVGMLDEVDIMFKYQGEILYYGTSKDKCKDEIKLELIEKVRELKAIAVID